MVNEESRPDCSKPSERAWVLGQKVENGPLWLHSLGQVEAVCTVQGFLQPLVAQVALVQKISMVRSWVH